MFNYKKNFFPMIFTTFFSYSTNKTESPCTNSKYSQCLNCFSYLLPAVSLSLSLSLSSKMKKTERAIVLSVSHRDHFSIRDWAFIEIIFSILLANHVTEIWVPPKTAKCQNAIFGHRYPCPAFDYIFL